jgi:hypothetical protein
MKKCNVFYLVVLGAAMAFAAGCGSGTTTVTSTIPTPTPTPTPTVSVTASAPAYVQIGVNSPSTYLATATVTGSTNTTVAWSTSNANLAMVDSATGVITPSTTNTGTVTITATAAADSSATSVVNVKVVDWVLVENQANGMQIANGDGSGSPVTLMRNNQPCAYAVWSYDHFQIACIDINSPGPSVVNLYTTDGTSAGTKLAGSIDLGAMGISQVNYFIFSLDGKSLYFSAEIGGGVQPLYSVSVAADANGNRALTKLYEGSASNILISGISLTPNDKQILLENVSTLTVYAINVDGTNYHELISAPSVWAAYSPDMSTLYYTNYSGGMWLTYVEDVATGTIVKTIPGYEIVAVSPNGASILLADGTGEPGDIPSLFTANADGTNISSTPLALGSWGSW